MSNHMSNTYSILTHYVKAMQRLDKVMEEENPGNWKAHSNILHYFGQLPVTDVSLWTGDEVTDSLANNADFVKYDNDISYYYDFNTYRDEYEDFTKPGGIKTDNSQIAYTTAGSWVSLGEQFYARYGYRGIMLVKHSTGNLALVLNPNGAVMYTLALHKNLPKNPEMDIYVADEKISGKTQYAVLIVQKDVKVRDYNYPRYGVKVSPYTPHGTQQALTNTPYQYTNTTIGGHTVHQLNLGVTENAEAKYEQLMELVHYLATN